MRGLVAFAVVGLLSAPSILNAQGSDSQKYDAQWIWHSSAVTNAVAAPHKAWFRREVRAEEPATGEARVLCDGQFTLWVNGQLVGHGSAKQLYRFNLNGVVGRGPNIVAVEVETLARQGGLFVDGEIRGESGTSTTFDTGGEWFATTTPVSGAAWLAPHFDVSTWKPARVIGQHAQSPWSSIVLKESDFDQFDVPAGFELSRAADPQMVGSLIAMTWGNRGRLIVSRENGPILSLIDDNGDGVYDRAQEYTKELKNCQGLCTVGNALYAVGEGPRGVGIYRLIDRDGDDRADQIELVHHHKEAMAEHGPHDIIFGPDGWLYYNLGNLGHVNEKPESTTACRDYDEDYLLVPRYETPGDVFRGLKAPGGTIWRLTPDGKHWWCEVSGLRNGYDFAFSSAGEMFTADSDMEWDVGAYFYRPVRVNHCIPGAEFGWRAGTSCWPAYYFDSLPAVVDVGRGSPAGVVFYDHTQFPERLRGALLVCDWSMGRILAVHLKKSGGTYVGDFETLLSGHPLNVSDIEVDRDGSLVFVTGGRQTQGGVYRLRYATGSKHAADAKSVAELLKLPQIQAAWAREIAARVKSSSGDAWETALVAAARSDNAQEQIRALTLLNQLGPPPKLELLSELSQTKAPAARAFVAHLLGFHEGDGTRSALTRLLSDSDATVRRRACEAFVRSGMEAPVDGLLKALTSEDRALRFAARVALERVPAEKWLDAATASANPHVVFESLLALYHRGRENSAERILRTVAPLLDSSEKPLSTELELAALRLVQLGLLQGVRNESSAQIAKALLDRFPTGQTQVDAEIAEILAVMSLPGTGSKLLKLAETTPGVAQQLHYVLALSYLRLRWPFESKRRLLHWYEHTRDWEGGKSLTGYAAEFVRTIINSFLPDERRKLVLEWPQYPTAAALVLRSSSSQQIADYEALVSDLVDHCATHPGPVADGLIDACLTSLNNAGGASRLRPTRSDNTALHRKIQRLMYERNPDTRDIIARIIANNPTTDDWPLLVRTLRFGDETTLQVCLHGLARLDRKADNAEAYRDTIQAGLKLGNQGAPAARLLAAWTGVEPPAGADAAHAMAFYQNWFSREFPAQPPAVLESGQHRNTKYTVPQMMDALKRTSGHAERGRLVYAKARCANCHRFRNEGESLGPDLTSVRRRFQQKEIIEAVLYPSAVIPDQFRTVQIRTKDGLVHVGLPLAGAASDGKLTLLLNDATKIEIAKDLIEEQHSSKVSVMPTNLLDSLTPQEIADLFAFLETSKSDAAVPNIRKNNAEAPGDRSGKGTIHE